MIQVKHLSRSYGDFKAVDNISFEIKSGEVVGLLGQNDHRLFGVSSHSA